MKDERLEGGEKIEFKKSYWFGPTFNGKPKISCISDNKNSEDKISWWCKLLNRKSKIPKNK